MTDTSKKAWATLFCVVSVVVSFFSFFLLFLGKSISGHCDGQGCNLLRLGSFLGVLVAIFYFNYLKRRTELLFRLTVYPFIIFIILFLLWMVGSM